MADRKDKTLFCTFCGKDQHSIAKLVAGPNVFICDECINQFAADDVPAAASAATSCSFCDKSIDAVERLHSGPSVNICNECLVISQRVINSS